MIQQTCREHVRVLCGQNTHEKIGRLSTTLPTSCIRHTMKGTLTHEIIHHRSINGICDACIPWSRGGEVHSIQSRVQAGKHLFFPFISVRNLHGNEPNPGIGKHVRILVWIFLYKERRGSVFAQRCELSATQHDITLCRGYKKVHRGFNTFWLTHGVWVKEKPSNSYEVRID